MLSWRTFLSLLTGDNAGKLRTLRINLKFNFIYHLQQPLFFSFFFFVGDYSLKPEGFFLNLFDSKTNEISSKKARVTLCPDPTHEVGMTLIP